MHRWGCVCVRIMCTNRGIMGERKCTHSSTCWQANTHAHKYVRAQMFSLQTHRCRNWNARGQECQFWVNMHKQTHTHKASGDSDQSAIHPSIHLSILSSPPAPHFKYVSSHNETWTACGWTTEYEREAEDGRGRAPPRREKNKIDSWRRRDVGRGGAKLIIMSFLPSHRGGKWSFSLNLAPWKRRWWMAEYVCRKKPSFLISPVQLKCDWQCVFSLWLLMNGTVYLLTESQNSSAVERLVRAFIRGRVMKAFCVNEELRLREIKRPVTQTGSVAGFSFRERQRKEEKRGKPVSVSLDGTLMLRHRRTLLLMSPPPALPPPLLWSLNVVEEKVWIKLLQTPCRCVQKIKKNPWKFLIWGYKILLSYCWENLFNIRL